jgi:hypothetical protein
MRNVSATVAGALASGTCRGGVQPRASEAGRNTKSVPLAATGVAIVDEPVGFDAPFPQPARTVNAAAENE